MAKDLKTAAQTPAPRFTDPFSAMRSEMERMFDSFSFGRFPSLSMLPTLSSDNGVVLPSMDIHENEKTIVVECELPGIEEKDIDVTLQDGMLTVKGEKKFETREDKDDYHLMERRYGSFRRSIRVPETVDQEQVKAKFDKGVLTVTLAKRQDAKTRQRKISVKSA
jgi:HSP20 family protein